MKVYHELSDNRSTVDGRDKLLAGISNILDKLQNDENKVLKSHSKDLFVYKDDLIDQFEKISVNSNNGDNKLNDDRELM